LELSFYSRYLATGWGRESVKEKEMEIKGIQIGKEEISKITYYSH
jgi:hypothetical protein